MDRTKLLIIMLRLFNSTIVCAMPLAVYLISNGSIIVSPCKVRELSSRLILLNGTESEIYIYSVSYLNYAYKIQ